MFREVLQSLNIAHAVVAVVVAGAYVSLWWRTRFWLPRYVHFLALVGLLIGFGIVATTSPDAPVARWGILGELFSILICPALVYFFFVFYGGQAAALPRRGGEDQ